MIEFFLKFLVANWAIFKIPSAGEWEEANGVIASTIRSNGIRSEARNNECL